MGSNLVRKPASWRQPGGRRVWPLAVLTAVFLRYTLPDYAHAQRIVLHPSGRMQEANLERCTGSFAHNW